MNAMRHVDFYAPDTRYGPLGFDAVTRRFMIKPILVGYYMVSKDGRMCLCDRDTGRELGREEMYVLDVFAVVNAHL
jgi:hypothetical protein